MDTLEDKAHRAQGGRRRPQRRRQPNPGGWIRDGLLVAVVVGSVLAIGSVHLSALLVVAALALLGAVLELLTLRRVPWPAVVLVSLGLFSAFQALPLPASWVTLASPNSAAIWLRSLIPFDEPALRSFSLSLDPGASLAEALKWVTYGCVYVMATRTRSRRGSAWLAALVFGSATLVTLLTLLHGVANSAVLYGVYHPDFAVNRWSVGPLLNSNNLGGYAILGLFSGAGLLFSDRSPVPRWPVGIGLAVIATALCLSGSRAAIGSVLLAGAVTFLWLVTSRSWRFSASNVAIGMVPLVMGIATAIALGSANEGDQLASLDSRRKTVVWLWSLPMIREHALFGVGRGAFETAFPPYREALDYDWAVVVTHAENFVVDWVAEWGIPVGLAALFLIVGYVLREWYRSRTDQLRFLTMTGLLALFVQNLGDLGLEVPGLAIAAVVALATGQQTRPAPSNESRKLLGRLALVAFVPGLALWFATLMWSRPPAETERRDLANQYQALALKNPAQRAEFRAQLRQAVLRHPGEPFFPLLGSVLAMHSPDGKPLPWIARALELAPTSGRVHLVLADLLHAHRAIGQALLHLRLAAQYDRTLAGAVGIRATRWAPSVDMLMQAIPEGPDGLGLLLDVCPKMPSVEWRIECFRRAAQKDGRSIAAHEELAEALLLGVRVGEQPCKSPEQERCIHDAELAIGTAEKLEPHAWRPQYLLSKVLLARGDSSGAAQLLSKVCPLSMEGNECWREALIAALQSGSNEAISMTSARFATRPCEGMESCAENFTSIATQLQGGSQAALASVYFTKAAEADPSAARWLRAAEQAANANLYGVARAALERADRSPDASTSTRAHAELLRQRLARASDGPPL